MPAADVRFLVTCEHGGNRIPSRYSESVRGAPRFAGLAPRLGSGCASLARALAKTLDAPLVVSQTSRLLVDLNRSEHHRDLFSTMTRGLPRDARKRILDDHYRPYRARESKPRATRQSMMARASSTCRRIRSCRCSTARRAARTSALLYDPRRAARSGIVQPLGRVADAALPDLEIRRNYPYRGDADGLTTALRRRYLARRLHGDRSGDQSAALVAQPTRAFRQSVREAICQTIAACRRRGTGNAGTLLRTSASSGRSSDRYTARRPDDRTRAGTPSRESPSVRARVWRRADPDT